jgi:hypothetical protein
VLVLGLLGGSAELARCPQFVSFSRAAMPVASLSSPVMEMGYQPVAFHASGNAAGNTVGAAHETLLKASMPVDRGLRLIHPVKKAVMKRRGHATTPMLLRSSQSRVDAPHARHAQGWVVLASWQQPVRRGVIFAIDGDREFSNSYAAVPTVGGWLVIQL